MAGAVPVLIMALLATGSAGKSASILSAAELGSRWGAVTRIRRSPEHNRAVGGVPNSFHLSGRAVDIARRPGVRHADIEAAYRKAGFVLLESLDEGDHSHFAFAIGILPGRAAQAQSLELSSAEARPRTDCPTTVQTLLELKARRRPDRMDGCPDVALPTTKYKPLEMARDEPVSNPGVTADASRP